MQRLKHCLLLALGVTVAIAIWIFSFSHISGCKSSILMGDVCNGPLPFRTSRAVDASTTFNQHLVAGTATASALAFLRNEGFSVKRKRDLDMPPIVLRHHQYDYLGARTFWRSGQRFRINYELWVNNDQVTRSNARVWEAFPIPAL